MRRASRPTRAAALITLAVLIVGPRPLAGQGRLISAEAFADASGPGPVTVTITYQVAWEQGGGVVPLEGLVFGWARITDVLASAGGAQLSVRLRTVGDDRVIGVVTMPTSAQVGQPFTFDIKYRIEDAAEADGDFTLYRLPMLAVGWPPEEALPETFEAEVAVPGTVTVSETFPSGLREGGPSAGVPRYRVSLPVIPALLTLRTLPGEPDARPAAGRVRDGPEGIGRFRGMWEAGFIFWGLFLVFLAILVTYVGWMVRAEPKP